MSDDPRWVAVVELVNGQTKVFRADEAAEALTLAMLEFEDALTVGRAVRLVLTYE